MANTSIKPISNVLSLPITYLPSLSAALTQKSVLSINPILSIRTRSVKLQSYLHPSLIPDQKKRISFPSHVAQTSDWAQQEEQGDGSSPSAVQALEEDPIWDDSQFEPPQPILSDLEASGEAVAAEDVDLQEPEEEAVFSEEAKLFVGNLPYDVDSERLAQLFEPAGVVEIAEVIYNRETDQSRGFGFVTMSTVEEAEKAVEMFNRYDINGRSLTVNKAAPRGTRPEPPIRTFESSSRIYVGNLPWDVDNSRLEEVFSQYGNVISARVVFDRETGRSRGFGFVTMSSDKEMNDAIAALDGQAVDGRTVRVNVAQERPRRSF